MLTELGVVGLVLFVAAMVGAFAGAIRARKLGPSAAQLSCGVLAARRVLVHSRVDRLVLALSRRDRGGLRSLRRGGRAHLLMPEREHPCPRRRRR